MKQYLLAAVCLALFAAPAAAAPDAGRSGKEISLAGVIGNNVSARGGLRAWRAVRTLTLSGRLDGGGEDDPELPFVMKMKRPNKSRLELHFQDQVALQVYNGEQGWKVRPFLGRSEVESYTLAEAREADVWQELDGPLMDIARKGTKARLLGAEAVEGHDTYKLKLTLKDGSERRVWIDAESFLERRMDGEPRKVDGKMRNVSIYYRDFRPEHGLVVPHVFETCVEGIQKSRTLVIDQVAVNQPMADTLFERPDGALVRAASPHGGRDP